MCRDRVAALFVHIGNIVDIMHVHDEPPHLLGDLALGLGDVVDDLGHHLTDHLQLSGLTQQERFDGLLSHYRHWPPVPGDPDVLPGSEAQPRRLVKITPLRVAFHCGPVGEPATATEKPLRSHRAVISALTKPADQDGEPLIVTGPEMNPHAPLSTMAKLM